MPYPLLTVNPDSGNPGSAYQHKGDGILGSTIEKNKAFLEQLFFGDFTRHALLFHPEKLPFGELGDFTLSDEPVEMWRSWGAGKYQNALKWHEGTEDDSVPYLSLNSNTGIFAAAFGCSLHAYQEDTPAAAMPRVNSAEEAGNLSIPDIDNSPTLRRIIEFGLLMRKELGEDVPIGVPDIQSPFDIAALIWNKESLFVDMVDNPDAVIALTNKCGELLVDFLQRFVDEVGNVNMSHCPYAWAPPEKGIWLSEDEVGSMSPPMFEKFCLPWLEKLSGLFGGMFLHCCARADHQYDGFMKIPNLHALNRVFQMPEPGPVPALEKFSGKTVFMQAWLGEQDVEGFLDIARPDTRYLFNVSAETIDDAKAIRDRLLPALSR